MEFDDDYLQRDHYYRENILGGDEYDADYGDMEEQGYDAMADDDVYDNAPQGGYQPNVFGDSRYDEVGSEEADLMQRVWRDYHVLGYADDDGDDREAKSQATRQERNSPPQQNTFQPMSQKYREEYAKKQVEKEEKKEKEAARIIRANRAACIAAATAVLISLLLIFL